MVLSAVGSTTVSVVSYASAVVPSNTMFATSIPLVEVSVGLLIIGAVRVLLVRVWVSVVPTTELVDAIP